eukprot:10621908-Karenia_brevis.AAC.1
MPLDTITPYDAITSDNITHDSQLNPVRYCQDQHVANEDSHEQPCKGGAHAKERATVEEQS